MDQKQWEELHKKAKEMSKKQYSSQVSDLSSLTQKEVNSIIKESQVDKDKLSELIKIINDSSKSNKQKAKAIKTTKDLAEVAVALIGKLI